MHYRKNQLMILVSAGTVLLSVTIYLLFTVFHVLDQSMMHMAEHSVDLKQLYPIALPILFLIPILFQFYSSDAGRFNSGKHCR